VGVYVAVESGEFAVQVGDEGVKLDGGRAEDAEGAAVAQEAGEADGDHGVDRERPGQLLDVQVVPATVDVLGEAGVCMGQAGDEVIEGN